MLFYFLNLNPHKGKPFAQHVKEFDFLGLFLLIGGAVCLLLGFNNSETNCECVHPARFPTELTTM